MPSIDFYWEVEFVGGDVELRPDSGPTTGGQYVSVLGTGVGMTAHQDDFTGGALGDLWNAYGSYGSLAFATGLDGIGRIIAATLSTSAASAGFMSNDYVASVDTSIDVTFLSSTYSTSEAKVLAKNSLWASDTTYFEARLVKTSVRSYVEVLAYISSKLSTSYTVDVDLSSTTTVRLLRASDMVRVYVGGNKIGTFRWTEGEEVINVIGVENDASLTSTVSCSFSGFLRQPVIEFDRTPMETILFRYDDRVDGYTPAHRQQVVDVTVTTTTENTTDDAYEYIEPIDYLTVGRHGASIIKVVSDPKLRN